MMQSMNVGRFALGVRICGFVFMSFVGMPLSMAAPLESWKAGPSKQRILDYVAKATDPESGSYIPYRERIAVFDSNGTLWSERAYPAQWLFTFERVRVLKNEHPEWKTEQPFKAVIENDVQYLSHLTDEEAFKLLAITQNGITENNFSKLARQWVTSARESDSGLTYSERVYLPMVELVKYLRENAFKTYIVSEESTEFVRSFAEDLFGVPPEQVIGSNVLMSFSVIEGVPQLVRSSQVVPPLNQGSGKPVSIERNVGKVPLIAVGNSDGDVPMLEYAQTARRPSLQIVIQHDDPSREFAYKKGAEVALKEAQEKKWSVVSMKNDFATVYRNSPRQMGGRVAPTENLEQ